MGTSTTPKVSIGMPVYNGSRYVAEAIESILNQTFADFELIICDNASTDNTEAICREYAARDPRIRYVRNERNVGAAPNYNKTFQLARGVYFRWHAHDDLIAPTYLEKTVPVLDNDPGVVVVHSYTRLIDEHGATMDFPREANGGARLEHMVPGRGKLIYGVDPLDRKLDSPRVDQRFRSIVLRTFWCHEIFGLMRRTNLARGGLMEPFYGTDKVILAEMAAQGRYHIVPEELFMNRRHPEQSGSIDDKRTRDAWNDARAARMWLSRRTIRMRGLMRAVALGKMNARDRAACYRAIAEKVLVAAKPVRTHPATS